MDETVIQIHINLPDSLTELVKAHVGERTVHVHLPDSLSKVVRDVGAELTHERQLMRAAVEEMGEVLKQQISPQINVVPSAVSIDAPKVKVQMDMERVADVLKQLVDELRARVTA